jgi:hypothetical protein
MSIAYIQLSYRQVIDHSAAGSFEKNVFNDSYCEFLLQAQRYNKDNRFSGFREIAEHDPKANSLHYKVGFAIGLYVQELGGHIPGLYDMQQRINIPFAEHQFEIIASDVHDKRQHVVAITYTTGAIAFAGTAGDCLILSFDDPAALTPGTWMRTFLLTMQPELTISGYLPGGTIGATSQVPAFQTHILTT